jgi:hypothetical protein
VDRGMNDHTAATIINVAIVCGAVYLAVSGWPWLSAFLLLFMCSSKSEKDD